MVAWLSVKIVHLPGIMPVIASVTETVKGELPHLASLMGCVVRLALAMQLHQKGSLSHFENEMRQRV
ncbi:hypothetical protein B0T26DRAFT_685666 [Lasiosphaeria miniovina]|uniref:Uncharacterized protein n=1 Tax=Lasiosphaeria miniovina TaxID=1954250 RepID=A0AA40BGG1_9PEZI|nr:uncharacterized protein B0T26DRAFT_685666 [Lasiosphaeria miniovina]KAK0733764.1 hypothetical protein B0T26DRAFT_685666 [Lasiosphaeria miniovina]